MGLRDEWFENNPEAAGELDRYLEEAKAGRPPMSISALARRMKAAHGWPFGPADGPDTNFDQVIRARLGCPSPSRTPGVSVREMNDLLRDFAPRAARPRLLSPAEDRQAPPGKPYSSQYRRREYHERAWWALAKCSPRRKTMVGLGLAYPDDMEESRRYGYDFPARFTMVERDPEKARAHRAQGFSVLGCSLSRALREVKKPLHLLFADTCTGFAGDILEIADSPRLLARGAVVLVNMLAGRDPRAKQYAESHGLVPHRGLLICHKMGGKLRYAWSYHSRSGKARMDTAVFTMPK